MTIEELLHEQLADGPQELLHEEISKTPEEEFPSETVFSENDTINETINAGLTTSKISPKKHSKPKSSGHTHRLSKPCRRRRYLANLISVSPYVTMPEMAKKTGVSRPTIARDLAEMKQAGIIRRVGAVKNGYWELLPPEK